MPNEPRNKTGRTLRQQIKAAADATAAEKAAREGKHSSRRESSKTSSRDGSARTTRRERADKEASRDTKATSTRKRGMQLTKRHASQEQLEEERKHEREASKKEREGFHPVRAALEIFGNMGLGYRVLTGFIVFVLVVFAVLYPIGCTYYQAMRQQQQLEAVLEAVEERNSQIESKNKELETNEGIENQARDEYGWVKDGEHATVVTNGNDDGAGNMPSQVDETTIEPPHTWYYDILDVIFQSKI